MLLDLDADEVFIWISCWCRKTGMMGTEKKLLGIHVAFDYPFA